MKNTGAGDARGNGIKCQKTRTNGKKNAKHEQFEK